MQTELDKLPTENPCCEIDLPIVDWKTVRPVGEPIKGTWQSNQPGMQNIPKGKGLQIPTGVQLKGIFIIHGYDQFGKLIEVASGENLVTENGFEEMLEIDFGKLPNPVDRDLARSQVFAKVYARPDPITLQSGDSLLVGYKVTADDPNIEMRTRPLPLVERMALVAEQHRQRFLAAGIEDPDDLLKMLGAEELIQPVIPGFELPKHLPRRVPIDTELIGNIIEAEGCSDELQAALMAQIAIYGAPTICGLLAQAGVDESFIDSLTSNLSGN